MDKNGNSIKVLKIIGTRSKAIKMAPIIKELKKDSKRFLTTVCVTGQHKQMLDQVLIHFNIVPEYDLNIMQSDQSLSNLTAKLFDTLDETVTEVGSDLILAQGDTTTINVSSLIAYYHQIPFGHVEAALRTGNRNRLFPEEINRKVADSVASVHFAPTERAMRGLLKEGIEEGNIFVTGNTIIDAFFEVLSRPNDRQAGPLSVIPQGKQLVLITAYRRESFGDTFRELCMAIRNLALQFEEESVHFVYPFHLNPNVQKPVYMVLSGIANVSLIKPLDYLSQLQLLKKSILIMTDSGRIQEEAQSLKIPGLVLRKKTERPEGIEAGIARLVGVHRDGITDPAASLIESRKEREKMSTMFSPYGGGRAASRIGAVIKEYKQI